MGTLIRTGVMKNYFKVAQHWALNRSRCCASSD